MPKKIVKKTKAPKAAKKPAKKISTPKGPKPKKLSFEERLMSLEDDEEFTMPVMNENMREKLLKEEFKLRKKQPTAWTKTKYRKYALLNRPKKAKEQVVIQEERELKEE